MFELLPFEFYVETLAQTFHGTRQPVEEPFKHRHLSQIILI